MSHFTVSKAQLKDALVSVNKVTNQKSTKPVLGMVKISSGLTGLRLVATDLKVYLSLALDRLDFDGVVECLVDAKHLQQAVKSAPGKAIKLELTGKILKIAGVIELDASWDLEEYPLGPTFDGVEPVVLDGAELATAFKRTQFAVAKDMSCYAYGGLLFEASGQLVATDGRRLAISKLPASSATWEAVLVRKGVELVARVFKKDSEVEVSKANTSPVIRFTGSNGSQVHVRQLEGGFPKYRHAIPENISKKVLINREAFQPAVEQAAALLKDKVKSMDLVFDADGQLTVETQAEGVGTMKIKVEALGGPKGFTIRLNPDFVMDWLKSLEKLGPISSIHNMGKVHGTVVLGLQSEKVKEKRCTKAVTFQDDDGQEQTYVLMPIVEK